MSKYTDENGDTYTAEILDEDPDLMLLRYAPKGEAVTDHIVFRAADAQTIANLILDAATDLPEQGPDMNTADRWERVAATLTDAGIPARTFGRDISIRTPEGLLIEIRDAWWTKNPDLWIGYQVNLTDRDDLIIGLWPITKKRSEVLAAVQAALTLSATKT